MQENQFQRFENLLEEFKQYIERVQGELKKFNVASTVVIEFEGKQYRRVNRLARPGDVVIFRVNRTWEIYSTVNKPYRVERYRHDGKPVFVSGTGREHLVYNHIHGRTTDTVEVYEPIREEKTPNQLRAEIIEKAKKFVKDTTEKQGSHLRNIGGNYTFSHRVTFNRFIVNQAKRTVVVLVKSEFDDSILEKGVAKCHPQDVFNEHIGKAIALGRALNLDVSEFEQAVQPTEVVVGHKVSNKYDDEINRITEIIGTELRVDGTKNYWPKKSVNIGMISIIDDTNAIYDEVN